MISNNFDLNTKEHTDLQPYTSKREALFWSGNSRNRETSGKEGRKSSVPHHAPLATHQPDSLLPVPDVLATCKKQITRPKRKTFIPEEPPNSPQDENETKTTTEKPTEVRLSEKIAPFCRQARSKTASPRKSGNPSFWSQPDEQEENFNCKPSC